MSENSEGPYFEDFKIGQKFKSKVGRTITDVDIYLVYPSNE